jgi:Ca2+-binding EF-hand superfamily protein
MVERLVFFQLEVPFMPQVKGFNRSFGLFCGLFLLLVSAYAAAAQSPPNVPAGPQRALMGPPPWPALPAATAYFAIALAANMTLEQYRQQLRLVFRQVDADRDGQISAADAALHEEFSHARLRAMFAVQMIMHADLDGDGEVTEDELRRTLRFAQRTVVPAPAASPDDAVEVQLRRIMAADTDHDGSISYAEAEKFVDPSSEEVRRRDRMPEIVEELVKLAPEGKGVLTPADFEAAGEMIFRTVDANGDGTISADELKAYRAQFRRAATR